MEKPDKKRCQADIQIVPSIRTALRLGAPDIHAWKRCENAPIVIVKEKKPGKDGKKGSMSLCADCLQKFKELDNRAVDIVYLRK